MRIRVSLAAAACWLIALVSPALRGSTVVEFTASQLFSGASTILVGTATGQSTYRDSANVWTATTFAVSEVLKGPPTSQYTLRQYGGVIGNVGYAAAGLPSVRVGEQYLLVLDDTPSVTTIRGLFQGLFHIHGSAVSDAFGRSVYWQGVSAPLARAQASGSRSGRRAESYSSLRARILALVQGAPQPSETGSSSADSSTPQYNGIPEGDFTLEECTTSTGSISPVNGWQSSRPGLTQLQLESLANITDAGAGAEWMDALQDAIAAWNNVTSTFQIGLTVGSSSTPGTPADGRNTVGFSSTMQGGTAWTTGTLGITYFTYNTSTCYMTQASIYINWTIPFATDGSSNGYDFQSVVGHEIGHSFGLDHPNGLTPAAIMLTGVLFPGSVIPVQQSDEDGVVHLYGGTGSSNSSPDLVLTYLQTATTAVIGNSEAPLSVTATVQNEGTGTAGASEIGFYFSPAPSISASSIQAGSCEVPAGLAPNGEEFTCTTTVTVPSSLAPGNYFAGAIVEGQSNISGSTRLADSGLVVLTQANGPDLVVTALDSVGSGQTASTLPVSQLSVQNLGSAAGAFSVAVYFSTTSTISASDTYSGFSCSFTTLASGSTATCSGTINVPASLAAGTYYLGALVSTNSNARIADTGVVTLANGNTPQIATGGIVNAASYAGPALVPGGIAALFGSQLSNVSGIVGASQIPLPTSISGVSVLVNGISAPLFAVSNSAGTQQINFQVPWELAGTSAQVVVQNNGVSSAPVQVGVLPAQPGIFTLDGVNGVFIDPISGNMISAQNPAAPNQILTLYANSLGPVTNQPADGTASPSAPLATTPTTTPVVVTVGGIPSLNVSFSGMTPTLVGLYQINFQVPPNAPSGNLPVAIQIAGQTSAAAMLAVQAPTE